MNENGTTNGTKKRELVSIAITPYEEWEGKTTTTDKRFGDGEHKFTLTVPVPETEADAQEIYGVSLASLIEAGVTQKWYGARDVDNVILENFEKGRTFDKETKKYSITDHSALVDPNSDDVIEIITITAAEQKFTPTERVSQTKELKALKSELGSLGMSPAEAIAALKALKAQKGE